jgi:hypothetical protein
LLRQTEQVQVKKSEVLQELKEVVEVAKPVENEPTKELSLEKSAVEYTEKIQTKSTIK